MSRDYTGGTENGEGLHLLEDAFNRAVRKYFHRHEELQRSEVNFRVVEMHVIASHNPIHGYRVVLRAED